MIKLLIRFITVIVFIITAVSLCGADEALLNDTARRDEVKTLSLRTSDGLVIVDATVSEIQRIIKYIESAKVADETNSEVIQRLTNGGVSIDNIRVYISSETSDRENRESVSRMKWTETTVEKAAGDGMTPYITGLDFYEAYELVRAAGFHFFLDEKTAVKNLLSASLARSVFVLSSSAWSEPDGIYIDGVNMSKGSVGYNVVIIKPDGLQTAESEGFNLYDNLEESGRMAKFLQLQPENSFVAVSVKIGPGVFLRSDAINALSLYGSKESLNPELFASHAVIGRKGLKRGEALEFSEISSPGKVIFFDSSVYVDTDKLKDISDRAAGKAVVLTGTKKDDKIYVYSPFKQN